MHYLLVDEYGNYGVEHPDDCPLIAIHVDLDGVEILDFNCLVGAIVSWVGYQDLEENDPDARMKTAGCYPIDAYGYTPQSMFEDAEMYLFWVEDE